MKFTFWIASFYSVESGYMNSADSVTLDEDQIAMISAVRTPYGAMPRRYHIHTKDGQEFISVDRRLNTVLNRFTEGKV